MSVMGDRLKCVCILCGPGIQTNSNGGGTVRVTPLHDPLECGKNGTINILSAVVKIHAHIFIHLTGESTEMGSGVAQYRFRRDTSSTDQVSVVTKIYENMK